jgi:uncharacterized protein YraI
MRWSGWLFVRSIWWDVFGTPWEGRGTDKGWVNGKQVNRKEPIYEVWVKANGNETIGIGLTVFWNPSAMEDKAPTAYDIKKDIEDWAPATAITLTTATTLIAALIRRPPNSFSG